MYHKFEMLLREHKKTTYQVAKETGLSNTMFSDWKRGVSRPKFDKLLILARYFDVPVEYFADNNEPNKEGA